MTISEALKESKESGTTYMRVHSSSGFVRWVDGCEYTFVAEALIADDWEPVTTGIPKLTEGRWIAASEKKDP